MARGGSLGWKRPRRPFLASWRADSDDLIGLVVFANYPDLVCPPVLDHSWLLDHVLDGARPRRPGEDGTNIGDAIAVGLDALRYSHSQEEGPCPPDRRQQRTRQFPIRLTPRRPRILARGFGVTVHTIAIGRLDGIPRTVASDTPVPAMADGSGPNFALLDRLAELTGGRSFSATNADALDKVFERIDALEKSPVRGQILTRYEEHYGLCAGFALAMLVLDRMLAMGRLRRLP